MRLRAGQRVAIRADDLTKDWRAIAALRFAVRRTAWPWLDRDVVWNRYVRGAQGVGERAASRGDLRLRREGGRLTGRVCSFHDVDQFTGAPVRRMSVDYDPRDRAAGEWAAQEVTRQAQRAGSRLDFMIETAHLADLLPPLVALGFGVSARLTMGRTADALRVLADIDTGGRTAAAGLVLRDASANDTDAMVALNRQVFAASPEHCWFGASETYNRRLRKELAGLHEGPAPARVFEHEGRVVGWYSFAPVGDIQWGPSGGMGIVLGPEACGRGLLRVVYADTAVALDSLGIPAFRGGTSQPAVLHLNDVLERRTIGVHVRGQYDFDLAHFGLDGDLSSLR